MRKCFVEATSEAEQFHYHTAIAIIDLDYLKSLNDLHGHIMGDKAICTVAEILTTSTDTFGFAGRIGGDEFIAFLNITNMTETPREWVQHIVHRYKLAMHAITDVPLSLSVGISYIGQDGHTLEELIEVADARMYEMKQQNKKKHSFSSR